MIEQATASMEPSLWSSMASWLTPTTLFLFLNLTIGTIFVSSKLHKQPNPETENNNNTQDQQQTPGLGRSPSNLLQRLKSINFNNNNNLVRSPSNLLYRLKSFNFSNNNNPPQEEEDVTYQEQKQEQEPEPTLSRSHSLLHRLKSIKLYSPVVFAAPPPPATVTHFEDESSDDGEGDDRLEDLDDNSIEEVYSKLQEKKKQPVTRIKSDTKPASGEVPTKLPKKMKKSASTNSAFSHFRESEVVEAQRPATTREAQNGKKSGADDDQEVDAKADDFINRFKQQLKLQRMDSIIRYKEMFGRAHAK